MDDNLQQILEEAMLSEFTSTITVTFHIDGGTVVKVEPADQEPAS